MAFCAGLALYSTELKGLMMKTLVQNLLILALLTSTLFACKKDKVGGTVTDIDGNVYKTIKIGEQTWMVENLRVTHLNDGTAITNVTNDAAWNNLSAYYCWPQDNVQNKNTYGALYNWAAVSSQKLAPVGWHIPLKGDWELLASTLGGFSVAGGKMKMKGTEFWAAPNTDASNTSGFTALPAGIKGIGTNYFTFIGSFFSATQLQPATASCYYIETGSGELKENLFGDEIGMSVRCIKN